MGWIVDNFVDERDFALFEKDRYIFFVLSRILKGKCALVLSDHRRLVVCHSAEPFPLWIWCADDALPEEMEKAYSLAGENGFLDGNHRINMKYPLADYFMKRAESEGKKLSVLTNMFAYDCPAPVKSVDSADGSFGLCTIEEKEELAEFMDLMNREIGFAQKDRREYIPDAEKAVADKRSYFWKNAEGKNVASCNFGVDGDLASIGLVFTRPEFRRRHYAENLVWEVSKIVKGMGFTPMLYTDADYVASNACYEKIGFVRRGELCMIG